MARKKKKAVSFDVMVKFFLQNYDIPTKDDIDKLMKKMDHLDDVVERVSKFCNPSSAFSDSSVVLKVIKRSSKGVGFPEIQAKTGFEDKKLRNIIYNLHKIGKIIRKSRGVYIAS